MLTPAGQLLTLQEAARRVQVGLTAWSGLADKPELLGEALGLVDECKSCAVAPEALFRASAESALDEDAALSAKLCDLAQLLTAYEQPVRGIAARPARPADASARPVWRESHVLDGAAVYLDGFLGFTPQELAVVDGDAGGGRAAGGGGRLRCRACPDVFVTGCRTLSSTLTRMAERCIAGERSASSSARAGLPRPAGLAAVAGTRRCCPCVSAHAGGVRRGAAVRCGVAV